MNSCCLASLFPLNRVYVIWKLINKFFFFGIVSIMFFFCQGMAKESVTEKSTTKRSMLVETSNWKSEDRNAWQTSGSI